MAIELDGAVAQLGEHLLCKQGVSGSIPLSSTIFCSDAVAPLGCAADGPANDGRRPLGCMGGSQRSLSFEEIKVLHRLLGCCVFCIHCEEKIDLEASRCFV